MNSTRLITSKLANQRARKVLFTCVVYTNCEYWPKILVKIAANWHDKLIFVVRELAIGWILTSNWWLFRKSKITFFRPWAGFNSQSPCRRSLLRRRSNVCVGGYCHPGIKAISVPRRIVDTLYPNCSILLLIGLEKNNDRRKRSITSNAYITSARRQSTEETNHAISVIFL